MTDEAIKALLTDREADNVERLLTERRVHNARTFDMQPCLGCGQEQVVYALFHDYRIAAVAPEIIEENNRDIL